MEVLIVLVFVCLVLVTGAVLLFIMRTRAGDLDHGERLSLLPLEPDAGESGGDEKPVPSSGTGEAQAPGGGAGAGREGGAE